MTHHAVYVEHGAEWCLQRVHLTAEAAEEFRVDAAERWPNRRTATVEVRDIRHLPATIRGALRAQSFDDSSIFAAIK